MEQLVRQAGVTDIKDLIAESIDLVLYLKKGTTGIKLESIMEVGFCYDQQSYLFELY